MSQAPPNVIAPTAIPPQEIKPLMAGASSPGQSAYLQQQQQIKTQMAITGKTVGGKKRKTKRSKRYRNKSKRYRNKSKRYYGGATQVLVPQPPSGSVPPGTGAATQNNYTSITQLAQNQQQQAIYDKTVNGGQGEVAAIQTQNNKMYHQ
jgi:hypothetical protein